jgi:hypothetical protein
MYLPSARYVEYKRSRTELLPAQNLPAAICPQAQTIAPVLETAVRAMLSGNHRIHRSDGGSMVDYLSLEASC